MSVVQGLLLQCSMQWWLAGCEGVLCAGQTHLTRGCRQLLDLDMGMERTDTYCTSDISSMLLTFCFWYCAGAAGALHCDHAPLHPVATWQPAKASVPALLMLLVLSVLSYRCSVPTPCLTRSDLTCCGERNSYGYGDQEETGGFGTGALGQHEQQG